MYAELYWTGQPNATEVSITSGTPIKIPGATAMGLCTRHFRQDTNGRVTYIGDESHVFEVSAKLSGDNTGGSAGEFTLCLAVNGEAVVPSTSERRIATGAAVGFHETSGLLELDTNDYVEVFVDCSANSDYTAKYGQIIITKVG